MSDIEHCEDDFRAIEAEIERHGVALGIDWDDPAAVRAIVREALENVAADLHDAGHGDYHSLARLELRGLAALMLRSIRECIERKLDVRGGRVWQAFASALRAELDRRAQE